MQNKKPIVIILLLLLMLFSLFASSEVVRVALFDAPGYCDTSTTPATGYEIDYLNEIAKYTQWTYEYYPCTYKEGLEMVKNGELDLMGWMQKTQENNDEVQYAELPNGTNFTTLFTRDDSPLQPYDYTKYKGLKVGTVRERDSIVIFNDFAQKNNFSVNYVYFDTFQAVINSVLSGEIDAGLISSYQYNLGTKPIIKISPSPYYFVTTPFDTVLLGQLNLAQKLIAENKPNFQKELTNKYNKTENDEIIVLDDAIQNYLYNHSSINIVYINSSDPLIYKEKNEMKGFFISLTSLIERNTRLKFNYIETTSISKAIAMLKTGEADCFIGMGNNDPRIEENNLVATESYMILPIIEVFDDTKNITTETYGMPAYIPSNAIEKIGFLNPIIYPTNKECFKAIENGTISSFFTDSYSATFYKNLDTYSKYHILDIANNKIDISLILSKQTPTALLSILNQSINLVSDGEKSIAIKTNNINIIQNSFSNKLSILNQSKTPILILIIIIIVILVLMLLYILKTSKENKLKIERYKSYLVNTSDEVLEINFTNNKSFQYKIVNSHLKEIPINENANKIFSEVLRHNDSNISKRALTKQFLDNLIEQQECIVFEGTEELVNKVPIWFKYFIFGITPSTDEPSNILIIKQNINKYKISEIQLKKKLEENMVDINKLNDNRTNSFFYLINKIIPSINILSNCYIKMKPIIMKNMNSNEIEDIAHVEINKLNNLFGKIQELSDFEFNKIKLESSEFNLKDLALEIHQEKGAAIADKHLNYKTIIDSNIDTKLFISDRNRLKELINLFLNNAIDFTPFGGNIELEIKQRKPGVNQTIVTFSIKDDGLGISSELKEKIFLPFEKENNEISNNNRLGLGLSLAKKLVELFGGRIEIESEKLKGSKISFTIPLVNSINKFKEKEINKNIEKENEKEEEAINIKFKGEKVLVIEKNIMNLNIITAILRQFGLKVNIATNGQEGLDKFLISNENFYDLLLIDLKMPIMDGFEVTKGVRGSTRKDAATIPIIGINSETFKDCQKLIEGSGMNDYVKQPIELNSFIKTIAHYLK